MEELKNVHLTRQMDIIPVDILGEKITIIGAGAIGSFTALCLAKMGFENLKVVDFDKIETENMNCQFYRFDDINRYKAIALQELVHGFTRVQIETSTEPYERGQFPGIVISAVDSMEVRKRIWMQHRKQAPFTKAIIDPRMGAETALLYVMNPMDDKDIESYEKTLYTDSSAVQERCTAKATIYTACMLSGLVAKAVKDLLVSPKSYLRLAQWSIKDDQFIAWKKS
jgi:molybdopterin/thiamine biosynthesis adenylyltransferase